MRASTTDKAWDRFEGLLFSARFEKVSLAWDVRARQPYRNVTDLASFSYPPTDGGTGHGFLLTYLSTALGTGGC